MADKHPLSDEQINAYVAVMKEIKLRTEVITAMSTGRAHAVYEPATLESIGLQFRKCFELIAMASLSANVAEYSAIYSDFAKHWEAAKLVRNLRRVNADFYPKPVIEVPSKRPGVKSDMRDRVGDFLTEAELIEAHGRCGALLHGANPFGNPIDYDYFKGKFPLWHTRMVSLLNSHKIQLLGDDGFYLIHMKEDGHEEIRWYRFGLLSRTEMPSRVM